MSRPRLLTVPFLAALVPAVLFVAPPVASAQGPCPGYADLLVRTARGEVNWGEQFLVAHGQGRAPAAEAGTPSGRVKARRAAEVDAYAQALILALGLTLDGQQKVQEYVERTPAARGRLQARIQQAQLVDEREVGGETRVTLRVPLFGVSGLALTFLDDPRLIPAAPSPSPPSPLGADVSGLIIDARQVKVGPALLLQVVDEQGQLVYDPSRVAPPALRERGTAAYAQCAGPARQRGELSPRLRPVSLTASLLQAQAAPPPPRAGRRPLTVKAAGARGDLKVTVVVGQREAAEIQKADSKSGVLRNGNVLVVVDPVTAGVEGRLGGWESARLLR